MAKTGGQYSPLPSWIRKSKVLQLHADQKKRITRPLPKPNTMELVVGIGPGSRLQDESFYLDSRLTNVVLFQERPSIGPRPPSSRGEPSSAGEEEEEGEDPEAKVSTSMRQTVDIFQEEKEKHRFVYGSGFLKTTSPKGTRGNHHQWYWHDPHALGERKLTADTLDKIASILEQVGIPRAIIAYYIWQVPKKQYAWAKQQKLPKLIVQLACE